MGEVDLSVLCTFAYRSCKNVPIIFAASVCLSTGTSRNLPKKVKCTLVHALRLCAGRTAHRGSRGIALLFHDHGTRRGERSASRPDRSYPRERPGTHCTGGWVGPRASLDRCGKSRPHRDSIPGPPARSQSLYRLSYRALNLPNTFSSNLISRPFLIYVRSL